MFNDKVIQEIETAAKEMGVEMAALAAVAHIESGLRTHTMVNGRAEPLIRFEGHYFDRRLNGGKRERARRDGLSSPQAGAVANPASQTVRWAMLDRAAAIDRRAAFESASWGIGQVMGAHWAWLGYASVDALVKEARSGIDGQLRLMSRYIDKAGLAEALRARDWERFARGYNGPAFRRNGYDRKLAAAYRRYSSRTKPQDDGLKPGARGDAVRQLQADLAARGYAVNIDGIFGKETARAVRGFQQRKGLIEDGIVGPSTRRALEAAKDSAGVTGWIRQVFRRLRNKRAAPADKKVAR